MSQSAEQNSRNAKFDNRRKKDLRAVRRFVALAVLLFSSIYVLFVYVIGLVVAPNGDMFPRIDQGDMLLFYRLPETLHEHDVIVFTKNDTNYIGRIAACPGDICEVTLEEQVRVNGNRILENDVFYATPIYEGYVEYPVVLGDDEYFVLGDKREGAEDSRYFGPVRRSEIHGIVITVIRRNHI